MTMQERLEAMELLKSFAIQHAKNHGRKVDPMILTQQVGAFITRENILERKESANYWGMQMLVWPQLAVFALSLGRLTMTEAAVERGFSKQARVFHALRAKMDPKRMCRQMFLAMNYTRVHYPEDWTEMQRKQELRTNSRKRRCQDSFERQTKRIRVIQEVEVLNEDELSVDVDAFGA